LTSKTSIRNFKKEAKIINVLITAKKSEDSKSIIAAISKHSDIRIIGVENDETDAVIKSQKLKPNVLIMDLHPPGLDGVELAPIIRTRSPATAILMICDRDENEYACLALRAGISGFLLRNADMDKLYLVIKIINLGGYYFSSSIIQKALNTISILNQFPGQLIDIQNNWKKENKRLSLSSIERCIFTKIAQGLSDKKIAEHFNYSEGSITNIVDGVKRKTKLKTRIQVVIFSLFFGLIDLDFTDIIKHRQFIHDTIQ
jgi:DNA-binding NarL/FixJ family response regulator